MRIGDRFGFGGDAPAGRGPWARLRRPAAAGDLPVPAAPGRDRRHPAGGGPALPAAQPAAAPAGESDGPSSSVDRGHPRRAYARPVAASSGASGGRGWDASASPVRDPGGSDGPRPPAGQPPVATPPVAATPAARVRVPAVSAQVEPPVVLGRELPEVRMKTPGATVDVPAGLTALP
jgi:hypothetical protein